MHRPERRPSVRHASGRVAALLAGLVAACSSAAGAEEPALRWHAPIEIRTPAPFVQLPLTVEVYEHSESSGLADLRVVDARGARVPYAVLPPRRDIGRDERRRDAVLY